MKIYAIFDVVSENYDMLFEAYNDADAQRRVSMFSNSKNMVSLSPQNFLLVEIGNFDHHSGILTGHDDHGDPSSIVAHSMAYLDTIVKEWQDGQTETEG